MIRFHRLHYCKEQISAWLSLAWFYLFSNINRKVLVVGWGIVLVAVLFFGIGYFSVKSSYREFEIAFGDFMQDLDIKWREDDSWHMRFAMLKQEVNVVHEKVWQLENLLDDNFFTIEDLKEQIYFYKSVVAPEELGEGLVIFSTAISMPTQPSEYPIEVILRKIGKPKQVMNGHIEISVSGIMHQQKKDLIGLTDGNMDFSFKYFQRVKGIVRLQEDFIPQRLTVTVVSSRFAPLIKTYAWDEVASDIILSDG